MAPAGPPWPGQLPNAEDELIVARGQAHRAQRTACRQPRVQRDPPQDSALRIRGHVAAVDAGEHPARAAFGHLVLGQGSVKPARHRHDAGLAALGRSLVLAHEVEADRDLSLDDAEDDDDDMCPSE